MKQKILILILSILIIINSGYSLKTISTCTTIDAAFMAGDTQVQLTQNIDSVGVNCIDIQTSNFEFDCQNYYIKGSGTSNGLDLNSNTNINVTNCNISNYNHGIIVQSDNNKITNTIISNNVQLGMMVQGGSYNIISNNTFKDNTGTTTIDSSIYLTGDYNTISNNTFKDNYRGLFFYSASNNNLAQNNIFQNNTYALNSRNFANNDNIIDSNQIYDNDYGIYLYDDDNYNITNNNISNNNLYGLYILNSDTNRFENNIISNPSSTYEIFITGTSLNNNFNSLINFSDGNYYSETSQNLNAGYDGNLNSCSKLSWIGIEYNLKDNIDTTATDCMEIEINNITLDCKNYYIKGDGTNYGLDFNSFENNTIKNCEIKNFNYGARSPGDYNTFTNNIFTNNTAIGIQFLNSNYNTITSNTFTNNNGTNIIDGSIYLSGDYNTIIGNTFNNNERGLYFYSGSTNNLIQNNNFYANTYGLNSRNFVNTYNIIDSNEIYDNDYGIYLYEDDYYNITNNRIFNNTINGIRIWNAEQNLIHNNYFSNNINVFFTGTIFENHWNSTLKLTTGQNPISGDYTGGNYWSNSSNSSFSNTCNDADENGICDTTYSLETNNIDYLAITEAIISPKPLYTTPTPQDNSKINRNLEVKVSYNGNSISNCYLNLDNGTIIIMDDQGTSCNKTIDLSNLNQINNIIFNVTYTKNSLNTTLENRKITHYPTKKNSTTNIFPSMEKSSILFAIILIIFALI